MRSSVKHYLVSGRVQGVSYRASTEQKARALGLTGWVRNLSDGRVELIARGSDSQLKLLEAWLWQGPSQAAVTQVVGCAVEMEVTAGFCVLESSDKIIEV
ncbi:acylphosphatase [Gilvimarinus polysaccharolyticus]|uniref:acylphosphatase n=1 Tax=Gilvimarinus polysaccharolyticus TaxID=863921 RepID=UPI000673BC48|nr:acylphosphatase [Gilvimarinus polysaccharolyticus]